MDDERVVRAAWKAVEARWLPSMPNRFRVEMRYDSDMVWLECPEIDSLSERRAARLNTERAIWALARSYTEARQEDARKIDEQIRWVKYMQKNVPPGPAARDERVAMLEAFLQRLRDIRAGLVQGMRTGGGE